jgi:DNA-binding SARP family transcriptional activator
MLKISLLGDFYISHDEASVKDIDTPRLQSFLAFLILHREAPQLRSHLAFLFWPDTDEAQARSNLRTLLHHLRHVLPEVDSHLEVNTHSLQWRTNSSYSLDVDKFRAEIMLAKQASKLHQVRSIRDALERAIMHYKGDLLPSCYEDWIIPEREILRREYLNALEQLVWLFEEKREYQPAIQYAHRLLQYDPLNEASYRRLMRLHALNGDRAGALRIFHSCATVLKRELDVEPSNTTKEAYEQLFGEMIYPSGIELSTTPDSPFVGREKEWAQLLSEWHSVVSNCETRVVFVRGEAGIGKSKLVEELLQWAARQGIVNASARCYAAEGNLAYAPVSTWLRANPLVPLEEMWLSELARLLPEIIEQHPGLSKPVEVAEAWHRQHLFEALSRAIHGRNQPILLILDDLQWCDRDTLEWIHFLLRYDSKWKCLLIMTYRPEEIGDEHPLNLLLHTMRYENLVSEIDLGPLDKNETCTLASLVAGVEIKDETAQWLFKETEGNPLFVVETIRAGLQKFTSNSSNHHFESFSNQLTLPPKVWSLLAARLAQLSPTAMELARLAATIGREFSFNILLDASKKTENTLIGEIDELWKRRIIHEHGVNSYDFSHDKLREAAYQSMSLTQRRLTHHTVARALENQYSQELDLVSHQIAAHYEHAGLINQSVPFYLRAAEVARKIFANDEAIELLEHGLMLTEYFNTSAAGEEGKFELTARLWEALGDILELKAQHDKALQAYHHAQAQLCFTDPLWQARLHCKISVVYREQRLYSDALEACHQAELSLGSLPVEEADVWWDQWFEVQVTRVWAYYWLARWPEMELLVNELKPVVQTRGKVENRMHFLLASSLMHLRKERYIVSDEMLTAIQEALNASQEIGSMKYEIECQFELGFLYLWRFEFDEAKKKLQLALKLAENYGTIWMQTLCLTYLTILSRFSGEKTDVLEYANRAEFKAGEANMPDYIAAAKGNRAWLALRMRDFYQAEQYGQEAIEIWKRSPLIYPFQWQALWPLIIIAQEQDREKELWTFVELVLDPTQQLLPKAVNSVLEIAVQAYKQGKIDKARMFLNRASETSNTLGYS